MQTGGVHLGDGGGGQRVAVEACEQAVGGLAEAAFHLGQRLFSGERRHFVLELGQLLPDVRRQQVLAGGEGLAELDEDRTQILQRLPDPVPACRLVPARPPGGRRQPEQQARRTQQPGFVQKFVDTVPDQHPLDGKQADKKLDAIQEALSFRRSRSRASRASARSTSFAAWSTSR